MRWQDLLSRGLCLPSGTALTEEDLDRVIEAILGCKKQEGISHRRDAKDAESKVFSLAVEIPVK